MRIHDSFRLSKNSILFAATVKNARGSSRGKQRSAAGGRKSELLSRQAPGLRVRSIRKPEWANGEEARLEWDRIPRKALHRKACGEQSEDFCAAQQHENQVLFQVVKEVRLDFFDNLKES